MSGAADTCVRGHFAKRSQFRATSIAVGAGGIQQIPMLQIGIHSPLAATPSAAEAAQIVQDVRYRG